MIEPSGRRECGARMGRGNVLSGRRSTPAHSSPRAVRGRCAPPVRRSVRVADGHDEFSERSERRVPTPESHSGGPESIRPNVPVARTENPGPVPLLRQVPVRSAEHANCLCLIDDSTRKWDVARDGADEDRLGMNSTRKCPRTAGQEQGIDRGYGDGMCISRGGVSERHERRRRGRRHRTRQGRALPRVRRHSRSPHRLPPTHPVIQCLVAGHRCGPEAATRRVTRHA